MHNWQKFHTYKQRGEWVELKFMAEAAARGYPVLKPWGDSSAYDVGIDHPDGMLRVQVKGFSARKGRGGYLCRLRHGGSGKERYDPKDVDLFAIYIVPVEAWYLIPAATILIPTPKMTIRFYPIAPPRPGRHNQHDYEPYREAWGLLAKSRTELKVRKSHSREAAT